MDVSEFEQRLQAAFDENRLPIAPKVKALLADLTMEMAVSGMPTDSSDFGYYDDIVNRYGNNETYHQCCVAHYAVAETVNNNVEFTSPVHNLQLWLDSIDWLVDNLQIIDELQLHEIRHHSQPKFQYFYTMEVLWWFKWLLPTIVESPQISAAEIAAYNNKLAFYFSDIYQLGERSQHKCQAMQAIKMGDAKTLELSLFQWLEADENKFDDCWACQLDDIVRSYCFLGRYDKALTWAHDIINGTASCGSVPQVTNSLIAQAYAHTGQKDKALALMADGYELVKHKLHYFRPISQFMALYNELGETKKAVEIYQDNKRLVNESESLYEQMLFHIAASKLSVPQADMHRNIAIDLAQRFDARNGNDYFSSQLMA